MKEQPEQLPLGNHTTIGGYALDEVVSAMQKSIRRGLEEEALFWATELDQTPFVTAKQSGSERMWQRLLIIASEDVGLAHYAAVQVRALYETWKDLDKLDNPKHHPERLCVVHAVLILVRASKSRIVDNAIAVFYKFRDKYPKPEIPNCALDKHTDQGRQVYDRRDNCTGWKHFYEEGTQLNNCTLPDPYEDRAKIFALGGKP